MGGGLPRLAEAGWGGTGGGSVAGWGKEVKRRQDPQMKEERHLCDPYVGETVV